MKNSIIPKIISIALAMTLLSCSEQFIDIPPKGLLSVESFVPDKAVIGCYAAFYNNDQPSGQYQMWSIEVMGNVVSDDNWKGGANASDGAPLAEMELFQTTANNRTLRGYWFNYYKFINFFNTTIDGISNYAELSEDLRNRYLGEVRFLRAYSYMRLVMAFGNKTADLGVVVIDRPLDEDEIGKVPRSSYLESWELIIDDLKFAEENLPCKSEYPTSDLGRATQGAAQALLARSYMYLGEWADCETYAKKVIDSEEYQLEEDFANIYDKRHEHGVESIFEIVYSLDALGTGAYSHSSFWASFQNPRGKWGGMGFASLTADLLNEFTQDSGDPRIIWTFLFHGDEDISQQPAVVLDFSSWLCPDGMHNRKLWTPILYISPNNQWDINMRVMRFADVLLMYAEAANENGHPSEALWALNQVRKRARESSLSDPVRNVNGYTLPDLPTIDRVPDVTATNKDELRNAIWHERRVELAGECFRFYDLVRQGRAGEVMRAFGATYNTNKGAAFVDGIHEAFPIPSDDIAASNGTLEQNPGY